MRPALPGPVKAAGGGVFIPAALREFPTTDGEFTVVDDPADVLGDGMELRRPRPAAMNVVGANVRLNDTALDPAGITNSETSIAALGAQVVGGWNDGKNFGVSPGNSGYAYSSNGGLTFTDGGVPPGNGSGIDRYEGDPSLTVDNAGNFYYANLYTPDGSLSAISVNHGKFTGASFAWDPPSLPVPATATDFLDKEWIAVDVNTGIVYVTYTRFLAAGGNQIDFTRSLDQGATWDPPTVISDPTTESVQGSRVVVGLGGEVQILYFVYDNASANNYMRARRSTTQGTSFGPEVTLPTGPNGIFSNYGSGPAGFNRARGIGFPSLAIDRSGGFGTGRSYATWEETFNYYFDPLGALGNVPEAEANGTPATANPITIGQSASGSMSSTADQDWFSFTGTAGQNVILYLVPGTGDGFLRLFAGGGGGTANRAMLSYIGFGTGLVVYTLPANGTYYVRVLANSASVGTYTLYTGYHAPNAEDVARDTRDVMFTSSTDGVTWSPRKVINDDAPLFDNAFPEVTVDGNGQVFSYWMDHRGDAAAGINADYYYNFSGSGGAFFAPSIKVNDGPSVNWSLVASNLAPNFGDYQGMTADQCNVYANFADGRQGTPDSWMATIIECPATPTEIALVNSEVLPNRVRLEWYSSDAGVLGTVYRSVDASTWNAIGTASADGAGHIVFEDATVAAGSRYGYRLGVVSGTTERFVGEAWVNVPGTDAFAIHGVAAEASARDLQVSFSLPSAARASLELLDISGRSLERMTLEGQAGSHVVRLGGTARIGSGIYIVRLTQGNRTVSTKAAVVR